MATRPGAEPDIETRRQGSPSILAVVVTHNGREWLSECLASLAQQSYEQLDVLVVDDATFDSRRRPQIRRIAKRHLAKRRRWGYLKTPRALGFGGAINWAMSRVRTDADLLLFVHDDVALDPHSVENMVHRLAADESTAIVGPKIVAWDDPQRLEEVGMLIDSFGYPYKGLEEGEIDLGQHDTMSEVFYVTSTCMLVRHDVFKHLKGWDARMRAFSEDVDLCWRARLAGYVVRVEPKACARHAVAMARGRRLNPFEPSRYFIRRNRFRTVFKNASTLRLIGLIPAFFFLTLTEMLGFIVLRQPREIAALARALFWNVAHVPQTLSERSKVQKRRKVSDLKLSRLTVGLGKRVRFYISHQRDRMEEAWGRRAELFARRTSQAKLFGVALRGWFGVAVFLVALSLVLGFRGVWWSNDIAVGELLPFPNRMTGLWRAFGSPWRGTGLGQPGPSSPALVFLGMFQVAAFGAAAAAQKLMIAVLGLVAFAGAYRLVSDLVDRTGRIVAGAVYLFGPVGYAGLRSGLVGALVFGAAAPWVILSLSRLVGWSRPPSWSESRAVARVALGAAVSAAFVPGSLLLYLIVAVLLSTTRAVFTKSRDVWRSGLLALGGLIAAWALLLPWSAGWFGHSGPLGMMRGEGWTTFAASFEGHDALSVMLGQTPEGPVFAGLAVTVLGIVAVLAGEGQRRRFALVLWMLVAATGLFCSMFANGLINPFVASPVEAGVIPSAAFAALAGLAVGAFRLDLPRRGFGPIHWITLGSLAAAAFLFVAGLGPALLGGGWSPGKGSDREKGDVVEQVASLFEAEAQEFGQFRALWVGEDWTPPLPSAARPNTDHLVTGVKGQVIADLFESHSEDAEQQLGRVIASVEEGSTDRAGTLLGAFNIHFVVLERTAEAEPWLAQRDLALVRSEDGYMLLKNDSPLPRAGLYSGIPSYVTAIDRGDPSVITRNREVEITQLVQRGASEYTAKGVVSPGTIFLAESADDGWQASIDGESLESVEGGWGNAFVVPEGRRGDLVVSYPRPLSGYLWLLAVMLAWIVVVGSSFSKRKQPEPIRKEPRRVPPHVITPTSKRGES